MKIKIEYNSKVNDASRKYILDSILLSYINWKCHKTPHNFAKIPTHSRDSRYVHNFFKCAWNILSGRYENLLHKYVSKITFEFEDEDKCDSKQEVSKNEA